MQMTYDHAGDAMYIQLTDHMVIRSKRITSSVALDFDEEGEVRGIEVLHVRKSGIDPLALEILHFTPDMESELPDSEVIRQGRIARAEAIKRQRQKQAETQDSK